MKGFLFIRAEDEFALDGVLTNFSREATTREEALLALEDAEDLLSQLRSRVESEWEDQELEDQEEEEA